MASSARRVVDNAYPGAPPLPEEAVKALKGAVWQGTTRLSDGASLTRFKLGGALWLLLHGDGRLIRLQAQSPAHDIP